MEKMSVVLRDRWVCSLEDSWMREQKWSIIIVGGCSEVDIALQRSYATPGSHVSRISCQPFGCYGHHKFCARSLPSSLLRFGRGCHADVNGYGLANIHTGDGRKPQKAS